VQATANTADHANAQSFSYDAFGNLMEVDSSMKIRRFPALIRATIMGATPPPIASPNRAVQHRGTPTWRRGELRGYDAAGNLRGALNGDEYEIDPLNAIIERRGVGGLRQRYLYDADGERMAILYMPLPAPRRRTIDFTLRGASRQVLRSGPHLRHRPDGT